MDKEAFIRRKRKIIFTILKLLLLLFIVIAVPVNIYFNHHDVIDHFKSFDDVIALLRQYHWQSILVYIGIQIIQIMVSVIPGQAFQFAAGYLYGFLPGLLFSLIGATLGTTITFYMAKILGRDAVHLFLGEEKTAYYIARLNSKKAYTIVFLLYFIPGLPKDIISYVAGISEMNFKPFLILSLVARSFGMSGSLLIGALYMKEHYILMGVIAVIAVIAFILCAIYHKKIHGYIDQFYEKITH